MTARRKLFLLASFAFAAILAAPVLHAQSNTADSLFAHAKAEAAQECPARLLRLLVRPLQAL